MIKTSGMWCDLCQKPILSGYWWHIGINGREGHCHEECKQEYQREAIKFKDGAILLKEETIDDDYDPTPWCHVCGAKTKAKCDCGPKAEND